MDKIKIIFSWLIICYLNSAQLYANSNQKNSGDYNNNFSNVKGDISINYNGIGATKSDKSEPYLEICYEPILLHDDNSNLIEFLSRNNDEVIYFYGGVLGQQVYNKEYLIDSVCEDQGWYGIEKISSKDNGDTIYLPISSLPKDMNPDDDSFYEPSDYSGYINCNTELNINLLSTTSYQATIGNYGYYDINSLNSFFKVSVTFSSTSATGHKIITLNEVEVPIDMRLKYRKKAKKIASM